MQVLSQRGSSAKAACRCIQCDFVVIYKSDRRPGQREWLVGCRDIWAPIWEVEAEPEDERNGGDDGEKDDDDEEGDKDDDEDEEDDVNDAKDVAVDGDDDDNDEGPEQVDLWGK